MRQTVVTSPTTRALDSDSEGKELTRGQELQYGGATFESAALAVQGLRHAKAGDRYATALLDRRGVRALIELVCRLPRLEVTLTDTRGGRTIRQHLEKRVLGVPQNRLAQGILFLPESGAEYTSGRRRQALRTNLHRAREERIRCTCARDLSRRKCLLEAWIHGGSHEEEPTHALEKWLAAAPAEADWWIATDSEETPLAVGVITMDSEWALLHDLVSRSHSARWLLHTAMVVDAIEAGVRYICVREGNALLLDSGTRYFQRLLGYQITNLRRPRLR
jgi:hypothetical protein